MESRRESTTESRRASFAVLARGNEASLMRAALRLCRGNHGRAEDLAQETLIRAYQAYVEGRYIEGSSAWPWLQRILTNLYINDYNRRRKWESDVEVDDLALGRGDAAMHADSPEPGARLMERTLDEDLERALSMLTPELRETVMLVDVEGMEYEEAARSLGVPIGTVRSRLSRARMKLHDLLQEFAKRRGYTR